MYTEIITNNSILDQTSSLEWSGSQGLPNPAEKMRLAILRITEALHMIELKYNANWECFKAFANQQVDLDLEIDEIGHRIDTDIYHRYLARTLSTRELKIWLHELDQWENSYLQVIKRFEKSKRGEFIAPDERN